MVFFMRYDVIQAWGVKTATIFGFTKNYNLSKEMREVKKKEKEREILNNK